LRDEQGPDLPICCRSGKHQGTADQKDPNLAPQSLKTKVPNDDERSYLVPPTQELIGDALELSVPHAVSEPSVRRGLIRLNPCGVGRERDIDGFLDEI
jgi:hypothetical protein